MPPTDTLTAPLLRVSGLSKSYNRGRGGYAVLDDISFDLFPGETLGVVGESGCGKSTLARAIMRIGDIDRGSITLDGTDVSKVRGKALRELRKTFQMVFQDPFGSLDPRMTVAQLVEQPMAVHGISDAAGRRSLARSILSSLGLEERFLERTPGSLSGGQRQRVAIARALAPSPQLVVLDEPISALDVSVQAQVLNLLADEQRRLGLTYLFIVHDLAAAEYFCDRILVLYLGRIVESGTSEELFRNPQHPYTVSLFSAAPDPRRGDRKRIVLRGEPQSKRPATGCPFASRCPVGFDREICHTSTPPLAPTAGDGHVAACHFAGELKDTR
ncbi:peptide ABC transporter ATP-binding protein [Subtercola sp. Z020]|uniref:ABC transporter ATP-binding protein n=1 Tax=Subtercola sp. Z020 TaxID=2080582 RepID=UPI000CE81C4D|nr:oligopeptide/dipeptide ABC transporter ATP-binding protein [Subtercola sp. Z020]PPF88283.1 peptide ABC transporter ATP-binding protein [Subtercola sp. Z020]